VPSGRATLACCSSHRPVVDLAAEVLRRLLPNASEARLPGRASDRTTDDLLPGTTVNALNRSLGRAELKGLVTQFNQIYADKLDGKGALIPRLALPERYSFGDNFQSLDLRLSREFVFAERWRLALIGEVFNLYNAANLSGHSGNVASVTFGQPTRRVDQVFGSGGPRAFQLGARLSF
jgi:hypothetical protein